MNKNSLLSQSEMTTYHAQGATVLVQFRHAYEIQFSNGVGEFVLSPIAGRAVGLPYSPRGRFFVITPEHFRKMQLI